MLLFLLFLLVPLIEIALFINVGGLIGLWPTLAIVVLTAAIGTYMVRSQGRLALREIERTFSEIRDPSEPLAHGAMILFSGALLLTPGFFTDAIGFALLLPSVRRWVLRHIRARMQVQMHARQGFSADGQRRRTPDPRTAAGEVIDGEYEVVTPRPRSDRPSGWTKPPD
jgi:UPF0716 protein FxsA